MTNQETMVVLLVNVVLCLGHVWAFRSGRIKINHIVISRLERPRMFAVAMVFSVIMSMLFFNVMLYYWKG